MIRSVLPAQKYCVVDHAQPGLAQDLVVVGGLGLAVEQPPDQPHAVGVRRGVVGRQDQVGAQLGGQVADVVVQRHRRALVGGDHRLAGLLHLDQPGDHLVAALPRDAVEQRRRREQAQPDEQDGDRRPRGPGEGERAGGGEHGEGEQPGQQVARQVDRPHELGER